MIREIEAICVIERETCKGKRNGETSEDGSTWTQRERRTKNAPHDVKECRSEGMKTVQREPREIGRNGGESVEE